MCSTLLSSYFRKDFTPISRLKPLTDEQVFYDKFYLLVCTRIFSMTSALAQKLHASFLTSALVIEKLDKVQILLICMDQQTKLVKVIWAFDAIGQRIVKVNLSK